MKNKNNELFPFSVEASTVDHIAVLFSESADPEIKVCFIQILFHCLTLLQELCLILVFNLCACSVYIGQREGTSSIDLEEYLILLALVFTLSSSLMVLFCILSSTFYCIFTECKRIHLTRSYCTHYISSQIPTSRYPFYFLYTGSSWGSVISLVTTPSAEAAASADGAEEDADDGAADGACEGESFVAGQ